MKAIVQERYGAPRDVLELRDVETPAVGDNAVLVRVEATSVNPADWHFMRGDPYIARLQMGLRRPKHTVLGGDVAGRVETVGANVTTLAPGEEVYGCSFSDGMGGFGERVAVRADLLAAKPANLSFEQAAAVPLAGMTALQGLRDHGRLEPGQKVLIIGASGGVGSFAVQIAKALGGEVTGVCSTRNVDLVGSLGADHVLDYTKEDFSRGAERYDVILQVAGTASPSDCRRALTPKGTLLQSSGEPTRRVFGPVGRMVKAGVLSPFVSQRMLSFVMKPKGDDLLVLKQLIEEGKVTPVIDRTYPLAEVAEAIAYLEGLRARGKVVVTI
jgi:NADPH:quinone reductase-like Zn-dependent oxidoreductase